MKQIFHVFLYLVLSNLSSFMLLVLFLVSKRAQIFTAAQPNRNPAEKKKPGFKSSKRSVSPSTFTIKVCHLERLVVCSNLKTIIY